MELEIDGKHLHVGVNTWRGYARDRVLLRDGLQTA
ncbi:hypothetical protein KR51_00019360 [Rubidibacter lacunae KORDI 51-2]|uniref:Uncharacterized protein n=1 Tax=Rubidibacter lacunae KORDI 51-2 TaxID=582515 RepID=U5DLB6_9CHRO|nr:hypothetical protein KR51_00019360 [Rubidibacter lacunae KORDI 51-2]